MDLLCAMWGEGNQGLPVFGPSQQVGVIPLSKTGSISVLILLEERNCTCYFNRGNLI